MVIATNKVSDAGVRETYMAIVNGCMSGSKHEDTELHGSFGIIEQSMFTKWWRD